MTRSALVNICAQTTFRYTKYEVHDHVCKHVIWFAKKMCIYQDF